MRWHIERSPQDFIKSIRHTSVSAEFCKVNGGLHGDSHGRIGKQFGGRLAQANARRQEQQSVSNRHHADNPRYLRSRATVELSSAGTGAFLASEGRISCASTLPNCTPYWSKGFMFHTTPWVNTLCSYRATSAPRIAGVRRSARIVLLGRLPSKLRYGSPAGAACPKARALLCAKTLAIRRSRCLPSGLSDWRKPMKSQGTSFVPW